MAFPLKVLLAAIADGAALSGAVYVGHGAIVGLILPAGWDTNAITFQSALAAEADGTLGTYYNVVDKTATEVEISSVAESQHVLIDPPMRGLGWVKIRSGTSGSPANQSGAVVVGVVVEKSAFVS